MNKQNLESSLGHSFHLSFDSAFDQTMVRWLEVHVGKYEDTWAWDYSWHSEETDPSIAVRISFKLEKHATLFLLRWGDSCLIK